ncbi:DUF805 domain-containing protein [Saccharibacter sp. EH70]|uniref:DUF805 domain-containing protein n=1 Tax=Saccharibacter sp. EH70 TaxID=2689392 RepID=UPI00351BCF9A
MAQYLIIAIAYYFFDVYNTKSDLINLFVGIVFLIYCATCAFFFIPRIAVTVRRLHDTNHKSWWMWVPGYNLVLLCRRGNDSDNRFDFTPKPMGTSSIGNSQHMEMEPVMPVVPLTHGSLDFLEKLGRLREKGIITEEEFQEQKRKIL